MKLTNEDFRHLHFMYWRLINMYNENENTDYMVELKNIINKGNIKSAPKPPPPKARTIKQPGLFSWITKDRVEFISKDNKEFISLEDRVRELENKITQILSDFN